VEALKGVSLHIKKGEFVAILGHNGSGKSTLAKHFNALLTPTDGKCVVDGIDTAEESRVFDVRSNVGMVFQNPDNQIVSSVVEEDVAFAPENLGVPPEEIRRRVDDALDVVGMREYAKHASHLLSGGQKQRVAIAGVLAMQPSCIVLDEPTAMLDPRGRKSVLNTLESLHKRGFTIVIITHNMHEATLAERIIIMNSGEIAMSGTPREVYARTEVLTRAGLELPQIAQLMSNLGKQVALTVDEAAAILQKEGCRA
jgi:energy-coupling factor transport system ATP-binding protein